MAQNPRWIKTNYNPYGKRIGDCAIRAIVAATGLDYREVCKRLGVAFTKGKGLRRDTGIELEDIKQKFSDYFDIVEDYCDNNAFVPDEYKDSNANDEMNQFDIDNDISLVSGDTLNDFCDYFDGQGTFLVSLDYNPKSSNPAISRPGGHIVCARLSPKAKRRGFIDNWDSGEMLVDAYMRVVKMEPKDSLLHWKYDYDKKQFIV